MGSKAEVQTMPGAPHVVLPAHVNAGQAGTAPPSYEEAMGQSLSSVIAGQPELPPLAFIDIMPRCLHPGNPSYKVMPQFQSFSDIISGANQWLRGNPGLKVWKCETVERRLEKNGTIDLETMFQFHPTYGFNVFVYGLRMWLTKRTSADDPVQQLGLLNVTPDQKEVDLPTVYPAGHLAMGNMMAMRFGPMFSSRQVMVKQSLLTYEGLQHTMTKLNNMLAAKALNGWVLSVETASLKMSSSHLNSELQFSPDSAAWADLGSSSPRRLLRFLRVYYVIGQPTQGQIRMMDIQPEVERMPTISAPAKFESVGRMLERAQQWLRMQSGVRILNLETAHVNVHEFGERLMVDSDSTDELQGVGNDAGKLLQVLRVFYVDDPAVGSFQGTYLTSRLFLPARTGTSSFETMQQTMHRIAAWLNATGVPLFGVETTRYLYSGSPDGPGVNVDRADIPMSRGSAPKWLTAIRLYFPTYYNEPPPHLLPPVPIYTASETCTLL